MIALTRSRKERRMKRSLRDKWLERLRDPNTKQCRYNYVRNDEGSCCALGHLTDACGFNPQCYSSYALNQFIGGNLLPIQDGEFKGTSWGLTLIHLNDHKLLSLPEIADWIEQNVPVEEG